MKQFGFLAILCVFGIVLVVILIGIFSTINNFEHTFQASESALSDFVVFFLMVLKYGLAVAAILGTIWAGVEVYWRTHRKLIPTPEGNYPALVSMRHRATVIEAGNGPSPSHYHVEMNYAKPGQIEAPAIQALPSGVRIPLAPAFRSIVHEIAPGRFILGYNNDGAIYDDITGLLSTAIAGRPGTGKTTLLRFVSAQVLIVQGLPVLFDPHGSIADELGDVLECAENPEDINSYAGWLTNELDTRLPQRRSGVSEFQPILLLADEWPIISELCPDVLPSIRRIVLEGRKVGMYALISGQGLPAQLLGGSLVRDALSSRYVFNTTPQQARLAGLDNLTAKTLLSQLEDAGPGKAILASSKRKPELVAIPAIESSDLRSLVLGNGNSGGTLRNTVEAVPAVPVRNTGTLGNGVPLAPGEREQIILLAKSNIPRRDICGKMGKGKWFYETVKQVLDEEGL